tara:strand:+ start:368 stop:2482 length:2115 start_codon:yes stop_codon:yes gene_type:complete
MAKKNTKSSVSPDCANQIEQTLYLAFKNYQVGNTQKAIQLYQQVIQADPKNADANHLLGVIAFQGGDLALGAQLIKKAIQAKPSMLQAYNNLGVILQEQGKLEDAHRVYLKILKMKPDYAEAHCNLGLILKDLGQTDKAISSLKRAIEINPEHVNAYNGLGVICRSRHQNHDAINFYQKVLALAPNSSEAYNNLGNALSDLEKYDEAVNSFSKAIQLNPGYADAYSNLGKIYEKNGHLKQAQEYFIKALTIKPNNPGFVFNMGRNFSAKGEHLEAAKYYKKALKLDPNYTVVKSNLLQLMNYTNYFSREEVFQQHCDWQKNVIAALPSKRPKPRINTNIKNRRTRIAYISPDFRQHSVCYFFEPLLFNHDTESYEVFCYYNNTIEDDHTLKLKGRSEHWRDISKLSDNEVVNSIVKDGIDILVDLAGHTADNRLKVFVYRPAPIQVAWLGYPNTSGLSDMDYRLTDAQADPVGKADDFHTEKLIRLPHGFLCYQGNTSLGFKPTLPFQKNAYITFGSFNNLTKVTDEVLEVWSKILLGVPNSKLLLKYSQLADQDTRDRIVTFFECLGVGSNRLELLGKIDDPNEHLALYENIDIGLDPFPYNGTTTTMEALWMGVPTITLAGDRHASRVGVSILTSVGLEKFIASDELSYIELAISLANQPVYLSEVRSSLRERTMNSDLCNASQFAHDIETVYDSLVKQHSL